MWIRDVNPEDGDIIPGTGGVRKLRWGEAGSGERGSICYLHTERRRHLT